MAPGTRRLLMIGFLAVSALIPMTIVYRMAPRAPSGQPALVYFEAGMIPIFRDDFNRSAAGPRVIIFLSPTDPTALASARSLEKALAEGADSLLKVFLVWHPQSSADRRAPPNSLLSVVDDPRVAQFFDVERLLWRELKPAAPASLFPAGTMWETSPPAPAWSGPIAELALHLP